MALNYLGSAVNWLNKRVYPKFSERPPGAITANDRALCH
jgi:hypothetical protein